MFRQLARLDRLLLTLGSRVVTVSSNAYRRGSINFDDLQSERGYRPMAAYARSKLANLLFTYELQRRLAAHSADTIAVAAHPGTARTDLMRHSPWLFRVVTSARTRMLFSWLVQDVDAGALPTLRAATDPHARGRRVLRPGRVERVHRLASGTSPVHSRFARPSNCNKSFGTSPSDLPTSTTTGRLPRSTRRTSRDIPWLCPASGEATSPKAPPLGEGRRMILASDGDVVCMVAKVESALDPCRRCAASASSIER